MFSLEYQSILTFNVSFLHVVIPFNMNLGLLHDREWILKSTTGEILTQKKVEYFIIHIMCVDACYPCAMRW